MSVVRKHIVCCGAVQGVGFRYRAYYAARNFSLGGYVRNCYDGSVEMELEGSPENIRRAVDAIASGHFIDIERMEEETVPPLGETSFSVR